MKRVLFILLSLIAFNVQAYNFKDRLLIPPQDCKPYSDLHSAYQAPDESNKYCNNVQAYFEKTNFFKSNPSSPSKYRISNGVANVTLLKPYTFRYSYGGTGNPHDITIPAKTFRSGNHGGTRTLFINNGVTYGNTWAHATEKWNDPKNRNVKTVELVKFTQFIDGNISKNYLEITLNFINGTKKVIYLKCKNPVIVDDLASAKARPSILKRK